MVLQRPVPGAAIPPVNELKEIESMLAERVVEWTKSWKEQGIEEGRKEGRKEGHKEGRKEGLKEGRKEGLCETALAMIQRTQFDDATIADLTGLPLAEVQALRNRPTGD